MAFCGEEYAMKLVIITNPSFLEEEAEVVTALFDVGLEKLHLRKPGWSTRYWKPEWEAGWTLQIQ